MNDAQEPQSNPSTESQNEPEVATSGKTAEGSPTGGSPTILQIALSVVAAAFGVQTSKNRERDFGQGSPLPFIIGGIIFTMVFVLSIVGVVMLVLP